MVRRPQLRILVNSRCGRACFFCRPSGEAAPTEPHVELSPDVAFAVAKSCSGFGIRDIKISGGDPALWSHLGPFTRRLKQELPCRVDVISRHPAIGSASEALSAAGVDQINISLDSLDPDIHKSITGIDDLSELLLAIDECARSGVELKINMVVMAGINDHELPKMIEFCESRNVASLKLLDLMTDLEEGEESYAKRLRHLGVKSLKDLYLPLSAIRKRLEPLAVAIRVFQQADLGNPMVGLRMPSGLEVIIKDHHAGAWFGSICKGCTYFPCSSALMALRLTADARLQFCMLRGDLCIPVNCTSDLDSVISNALDVYANAEFTHDNSDEHHALVTGLSLVSLN